jgi:hypothetical protein
MTDTDALSRLRSLLLADEVLADRLALVTDPDGFAIAAAEAASSAGIEISPEVIRGGGRRDPLDIARFSEMPVTMTRWPGSNWLPAAVVQSPGQLGLDWLHFGDASLDEPFYEMSVQRARRLPINSLLRVCTPLSVLAGPLSADAAPDGLIFHMSRCGSTLVSQMLAAMPGSVVVSEAAALDTVVQLAHSHPEIPLDRRVTLLRGMAAALGRNRSGTPRRYVIKTDSWHSLALPLFRAAFPDTPWIFQFRNPVEVMVSQMREPGSQTVPDARWARLYGIDNPQLLPRETYVAGVLNRVARAAIDNADIGGAIFVDYAELPRAVEQRILPHFGIVPPPEAIQAMHDAAQWNAKAPSFAFESDVEEKRRSAGERVLDATTAHLDPLYPELTALARRTA